MKPYYEQDGIVLYHGDCREVLPHLPAASSHAMVSDPPYGTRVDRDGYGRRHIHEGKQHIAGDADLSVMAFALGEAKRLVIPRGWVAVFCSPKRHSAAAEVCRAAEFPPHGEVVWDKLRPGLGGGIRYQHETVLLCHRGAAEGRAAMFSVLRGMIDRPDGAVGHPHEKPIEVMAKLVCYVSRAGETVLDPFAGTGSTLVAAKLTGRQAIGVELEERWCEIAAKRLAQGVLFGGAA